VFHPTFNLGWWYYILSWCFEEPGIERVSFNGAVSCEDYVVFIVENTVGVWIAGGMTLTFEGQSGWIKICPSAILFSTYPTWTAWDWHQASVVSGCSLTAWAMAWLMHGEDTEQQSGIFKTDVAEYFRTTVNQPTRMCYHCYEFLGFYSGCH